MQWNRNVGRNDSMFKCCIRADTHAFCNVQMAFSNVTTHYLTVYYYLVIDIKSVCATKWNRAYQTYEEKKELSKKNGNDNAKKTTTIKKQTGKRTKRFWINYVTREYLVWHCFDFVIFCFKLKLSTFVWAPPLFFVFNMLIPEYVCESVAPLLMPTLDQIFKKITQTKTKELVK